MEKLYRSVGFNEMDLILNTGNRRFPDRLPEQPFFYPVLTIQYAIEIAKQWNINDEKSGYVGYVTEFEIDSAYISKFEHHTVGTQRHKELWIPAEELDQFNSRIISNITITNAYYGELYQGVSNINTNLKDKDHIEQFLTLVRLKSYNIMDYTCEILAQWKIITQNYFLWLSSDFSKYGVDDITKTTILTSVKEIMTRNKKWFILE